MEDSLGAMEDFVWVPSPAGLYLEVNKTDFLKAPGRNNRLNETVGVQERSPGWSIGMTTGLCCSSTASL